MTDVRPAMELSIVIVNWNTRDYLEPCLLSLRRHAPAGRTWEVIVVDNASTDGSLEMLRDEFPEVRVIANPENLSFTVANNQGLAAAHGTLLLCLNADTLAHAEALDRLCDLAEARPDIGLCSATLYNTDGSLQEHAWNFWTVPVLLVRDLHLDRIARFRPWVRRPRAEEPAPRPCGDPDCPHRVLFYDTLLGACHLLRRDVYERLGPQDETISIWCGDMDWSRAAARHGYRQAILSCARITHHIGGATIRKHEYNQGRDDRRRVWGQYEAYIHYLRKNGGPLSVPVMKALFGLGAAARLLAAAPLTLVPRRREWGRLIIGKFWGVLCRLPQF